MIFWKQSIVRSIKKKKILFFLTTLYGKFEKLKSDYTVFGHFTIKMGHNSIINP